MPLKPWYKVISPREDLRDGKPLDASELAVHPHVIASLGHYLSLQGQAAAEAYAEAVVRVAAEPHERRGRA